MPKIAIDLVRPDEESKLFDYIKTYWSPSHIFLSDRELFRWQHFDVAAQRMNFVAARDLVEQSIIGILGFIPPDIYGDTESRLVWLAIWHVDSSRAPLGVGLRMLKYIEELYHGYALGAIGISEMVKPLYRAKKYTLGRMEHFFIPNPMLDSYKLMRFDFTGTVLDEYQSAGFDVRDITGSFLYAADTDDVLVVDLQRCGHSVEYYRRRYLCHPRYHYRFLRVSTSNMETSLVLVTRRVEARGASALKIVDVIGTFEYLPSLSPAIVNYIVDEGLEYADIYTSRDFGESSGLFFSRHGKSVAVPNYFEPFELRNVDLEYALSPSASCRPVFRGDSDQDRPSMVAP